MSRHLTKRAAARPSQILPKPAPESAPNVTLSETFVILCDWHGRVVWKSGTGERLKIGEDIWRSVSGTAKEQLKAAVASVASLREQRTLELENDRNELFRLRMWPLNEPDIAICILAVQIPGEIALLTDRERRCLQSLAQGKSTREIVTELGIGLTTVHTHLRRSREKLGLASAEALIGFAARYFYVPPPNTTADSTAVRKRSG
jgi:DNA-binding CsgD family transcriptional regulator